MRTLEATIPAYKFQKSDIKFITWQHIVNLDDKTVQKLNFNPISSINHHKSSKSHLSSKNMSPNKSKKLPFANNYRIKKKGEGKAPRQPKKHRDALELNTESRIILDLE